MLQRLLLPGETEVLRRPYTGCALWADAESLPEADPIMPSAKAPGKGKDEGKPKAGLLAKGAV